MGILLLLKEVIVNKKLFVNNKSLTLSYPNQSTYSFSRL